MDYMRRERVKAKRYAHNSSNVLMKLGSIIIIIVRRKCMVRKKNGKGEWGDRKTGMEAPCLPVSPIRSFKEDI